MRIADRVERLLERSAPTQGIRPVPIEERTLSGRDLAVLVDEGITAESLRRVTEAAAGPSLQSLVIFDVYRGKGVVTRQKSVALGLILQDASRTLTDMDADRVVGAVMTRLRDEHNASLRE